MSYFKTKDHTELYYTDVGRGPAVLLIHGWPLSSDMWEYQQLALLEKGYRVIAYDRRGFGRSGPSAAECNYGILTDDLKALIEHLDLHAINLVGFSMGGGEVVRYLFRYGSSLVASATLISAVVPLLLKTRSNPEGVADEQLDEIMASLRQDRPKFLAGFTKQFYGVGLLSHPVSDDTMNWTTALANRASLKATLECVDAFGRTDFRDDLKSITVPTLIIHGTADKTVPIEVTALQAAQLIRGSTLKVYTGAPHGIFITNKDQLNADLCSFLASPQLTDGKQRPLSPRVEKKLYAPSPT